MRPADALGFRHAHENRPLHDIGAHCHRSLAAAHPGHAGHTHGEDFTGSALDALAGSGHPKVLLVAALLAAGVLIVGVRAALARTPARSPDGLLRRRA